MNEAQKREFEQIREEQTLLAGRLARLEARLRSLEAAGEAEPELLPPAFVPLPPLPPPMPAPAVPVGIVPPLPPEAAAPPAYFNEPSKPEPAAEKMSPASAEPVPPPLPTTARRESESAAPPESLEVRIGTTWLVRAGVVMVLTALVFLGSYLYKNIVPHLGPAAKVGLLYLGAGALAGAGAWLEKSKEAVRSPRMLNFARVVLAGGLAAVYYVTYAAHWNPSLFVLRSPLLDGLLLVAWTAFMVWLADRRGSEVLATFAVLLAYYASAVNEIAAFTLFSNLSLTVAAVYLLRRHLWRLFPYASLLATFGSYAFWHYYHTTLVTMDTADNVGGFWVQSAFLLIYWLLFTWSVFVPGAAQWSPRRRAGFAGLNNAAFFLLTTWLLLGAYPGSFWKWSLAFGAVLCVLAEGCRWVRPRLDSETEGSYLVQGLGLLTLGFIAYFSGWQLGLVLTVQSVVLLGRAQARAERLPLWASLASAVAAFIVVANQLADWSAPMSWQAAGGVGALLVFNAWWCRHRLDKMTPVPTAAPSSAPDFGTTLAVAPAFFSLLGLETWGWTIERTLAHDTALVPALAMAAMVLTASFYVLRVRAMPIYAPGFLALAYIHRFAEDNLARMTGPTAPAWSLAVLFVCTLAVGHWWQFRWPRTPEQLRPESRISALIASFVAVLAVMLLYDWSRPGIDDLPDAGWIASNAGLSLLLLIYGLWTRYRALAAAGQGLLLVSVVGCALFVWPQHWAGGFGNEMLLALVPVAVLLATIYAGRRYLPWKPAAASFGVYEATATLLFLGWGVRYIPEVGRFAFFAVIGAVVAALAVVRHEPRRLWWSGMLTCSGVVSLFLLDRMDRTSGFHLAGIVAVVGQQRFARYWIRREPDAEIAVPERWQAGVMIVAVLCAWSVLNARVALSFGGAFTLAASWSLFAAAIFAAGLVLHEKTYRWLGLTILVCTLGRIVVVDIWQLDGLGRAVSALCLGTVFLAIGYIYNRFHAKWHGLF